MMDNIKKIQNSLENIVSLRVRKILLFSIWKEEREVKNLTPEEKILYLEVKNAVERHKSRVLGLEEMEEEKIPEEVGEEKREAHEKVKEIQEERKEEYVLVRVKMPFRIALPEGNLELRKEDVLHLPVKIFKILRKKDIVEEI